MLRVAAYCRVSTDKDDQANSFESQKEYFKSKINENDNWELFDIYADKGISGTNTSKRTDFNRMMRDAKSGKIDIIIAKSISENKGTSNYRGTVKIAKNATNSFAQVKCDTVLLDNNSYSNTYPKNICLNNSSTIEHEATISKINEEKLFYLMSKGISEKTAKDLYVLGFMADFKKELPMEYAVELNQLLKGEEIKEFTLKELLPESFSPAMVN